MYKMTRHSQENETDDKNVTIWKNLVDWVQTADGDGYLNPSIQLQGQGSAGRGVYATQAIAQGDWLIRLPSSRVVSGSMLSDDTANASSWLKCLAAYYQASSPSSSSNDAKTPTTATTPSSSSAYWAPYLESLPTTSYETLFQWTDGQVQGYLAGTTLGTMVQSDRNENSMRTRYRLAVRPYLQQHKLLGFVVDNIDTDADTVTDNENKHSETTTGGISNQEFDAFLQACMCISTRGFHLTASTTPLDDDNSNNDDDHNDNNNNNNGDASKKKKKEDDAADYGGPFLLPVIDLLNHDPARKCTTLQRDDGTGMFGMKAERDIRQGEEVVHSYGDTLTAAQLLQTFGFVPPRNTTKSRSDPLTPACLSKKQLLAACQATKESTYPQQLQAWIKSRSPITDDEDDNDDEDDDDDDEVWGVRSIPTRPMSEEVSEDFLVSPDNTTGTLLSDELVTLLCVQFLPDEAYDEICPNHRATTSWLDRSILEDLYLGKLVCHSLAKAIQRKFSEYTSTIDENDIASESSSSSPSSSPLERDRQELQKLEVSTDGGSLEKQRAMYGLRIRIEEMTCLEALRQEVERIIACLEQGESIQALTSTTSPSNKRARMMEKEP
jgi:hypothetical protein